jgi:hypothetical protein
VSNRVPCARQVDAGTILETDSQAITNRVLMRGVGGSQASLSSLHCSAISLRRDLTLCFLLSRCLWRI